MLGVYDGHVMGYIVFDGHIRRIQKLDRSYRGLYYLVYSGWFKRQWGEHTGLMEYTGNVMGYIGVDGHITRR